MGEETILEWLQKRQGMAAKETITDSHIEQCIAYMQELEKEIKILHASVRHLSISLRLENAKIDKLKGVVGHQADLLEAQREVLG